MKTIALLSLLAIFTLPEKKSVPPSLIYKTQVDFLNNRASYESPDAVKHLALYWRKVHHAADAGDEIALMMPDHHRVYINPDSVFGFASEGVRFVYSKGDKKYLSLLNEKAPVYLALNITDHFVYRYYTTHPLIMYCCELGQSFKEFTSENLSADFGGKIPEQLSRLQTLMKKEGRYLDVSSPGELIELRQKIGKVLSE